MKTFNHWSRSGGKFGLKSGDGAGNGSTFPGLLLTAKHLKVRVIAAEQGFGFMGDLRRRDRFTVNLIADDVRHHPGEIYVIVYGTMHILGKKHLSGLLASRGHTSQLKIINHLGRLTQAVAEAINSTEAGAVDLGDGIIYTSTQDMITNLETYRSQLACPPS